MQDAVNAGALDHDVVHALLKNQQVRNYIERDVCKVWSKPMEIGEKVHQIYLNIKESYSLLMEVVEDVVNPSTIEELPKDTESEEFPKDTQSFMSKVKCFGKRAIKPIITLLILLITRYMMEKIIFFA